MIAREIRQDLFEILGFVEKEKVFRKITEAMRKLQIMRQAHVEDARVEVILIQSWEDEINIKDKKALLYMIRSQELYRMDYFDEAQKYEGLALAHFLEWPDSEKWTL